MNGVGPDTVGCPLLGKGLGEQDVGQLGVGVRLKATPGNQLSVL
jgi:hypothetical protein